MQSHANLIHWLIRLPFAATFLYHGLGKVAGPGGVAGFAEMMELPLVIAALVTFAEVAAGAGILLGGFGYRRITRLSGLAAIPVLLGAIVMVHGPRWSFTTAEGFPMGGMEFQVLLLGLATVFLVTGGPDSKSTY